MPEYNADYIISFETVIEDKKRESQAKDAMMLLQGEASSDAGQALGDGQGSPEIDLTASPEATSQSQEDGLVQVSQEDEESSEMQTLRMINEKRVFYRDLIQQSTANNSAEALEHGATFDIEKTYNLPYMEGFFHEEYDQHEDVLQTAALSSFVLENSIQRMYVDTGKKKVYRGNPELWTPLDKVIPEEEHIKIAEAMRDYVEPRIYEDKYQTRQRRQANIEPETVQKNYVELPERVQFVDDGRKM